jgi:hypothetical protein
VNYDFPPTDGKETHISQCCKLFHCITFFLNSCTLKLRFNMVLLWHRHGQFSHSNVHKLTFMWLHKRTHLSMFENSLSWNYSFKIVIAIM